jgi:hypothetical protein
MLACMADGTATPVTWASPTRTMDRTITMSKPPGPREQQLRLYEQKHLGVIVEHS